MKAGYWTNGEDNRGVLSDAIDLAVGYEIDGIKHDPERVAAIIREALDDGSDSCLIDDIANIIVMRRMTSAGSFSVQRAVMRLVGTFDEIAEPYAYLSVSGRVEA